MKQFSLSCVTATALILLSAGCGSMDSAVTSTPNPQVALYQLMLHRSATVTVEFGKHATYGFQTSSQHFEAGTMASIEVAGMLAQTTYHMRAIIDYDDGSKVYDSDHVFTTGSIPAGVIPNYSVETTGGLTPQPGVELVNGLPGNTPGIPFATDLSGNVIWTYPFPDRQADSQLFPIKLLPNGHLMCLISAYTSILAGPISPNSLNVVREIDLAGSTVRQITMADLNARLAAAGFNLRLQIFSHDFVVLPNGHILVIANFFTPYTDLPGHPGTTNVLGDAVVDLDQNLNPKWVWNEFDHLDINRQPLGFPDWTHSNALAYSPDDGNFLISIRNQNWIIKVDYNNGAGTGNIIWKLGYQGDFTLQGAVDPTDWFYAQHDVNFVSPNSTGNFEIGVMDNGDDRVFPSGIICGSAGAPACLYSSAQVMRVDENQKTASFVVHDIVPPDLFNPYAGDTRVQPNGNIEYDLAGDGPGSYVFEVTPTNNPQTVWQMHLSGTNTYRVVRMPSLYPGVQW